MSNFDYVANAFVRIKPDISGFRNQLRADLKASIGSLGAIPVPVKPQLTQFKRDFQAQLRASPVEIPVTADLTRFNAQIDAAVRKAAARNKVIVPVETVNLDRGTGGMQGRAKATQQLAGIEESRARILSNLERIQRNVNTAIESGLPAAARDATLRKAQSAAEAELASALTLTERSSAKATQSVARRAAATVQSVAATREQIRVESQSGGATQAKEAATKKAITVDQQRLRIGSNLARIETDLKEAISSGLPAAARDATLKRLSAEAEAELAAAMRLTKTSSAAATTALRERAAASVQSVAAAREQIKATATQVAADEKLTAEKVKLRSLLAQEAVGISTVADLQLAEARTTTALAQAKRTLAAARAANAASAEIDQLKTLESSLIAQKAAIDDLTKADKRSNDERKKRIATERTFAKGLSATGLSLFGIRGATLAASGPFLAGAAAAAVFAKSIQSFATFETSLNVFAETAQATTVEMQRASQVARQLGADVTLPAVSAADAADAFSQLSKAGLDATDSIDGARGVLQLATAAQISNAEATELVASALNAFGREGDEAVVVADLLTGASNEAQGSISDMGIALQQSAAAGRQAGLSLEDTVALLTLLARNGLRGSDAGTSLRTALLRLIRPTKNAQEQLDKLNVRIRDAQGNIRAEVFADLGVALGELGKKQRDAALAVIFGQDAFRSASILAREGSSSLDAMREATQREGLAAQLAAARTKGLAGQFEALRNNLETLGTSIGRTAAPIISGIIGPFSDIVSFANAADEQVRAFLDHLSEGEIDAANDSLATAVTKFQEISQAANSFDNKFLDTISGEQSLIDRFFAIDEDALGEATEELEHMVELMKISGSTTTLTRAFSQASPIIAKAIRDGVITPAEKAQLEVDELGAIFLKGLPADAFVGLGAAARGGIEEMAQATKRGMVDVGANIRSGIEDAARSAIRPAKEAGEQVGTAFIEGLMAASNRIEGQLGGLSEQVIRAQIAGNREAELAALRQQEAKLRRDLAIQEAIIAQPGTKGEATARERIRQEILPDLQSVTGQIESLLDEADREVEEARNKVKERKDKIKQAQEDAYRDLIEAFNFNVSQQQNEILKAQGTKTLKDDLRQNRILKGILVQIINSGKLRKEELQSFQRALISINQEIDRIVKQIAQDRKDALQERRERLQESLELDIDLAVLRENRSAEIRARRALIRNLREQQGNVREGSVEWKRLRNEIAAQEKAIEEAKKAAKERNLEFQAFLFEQLQRQQGFAANLFGNLIPTDFSGLVGNAAPPAGAGPSPGGGPFLAQRQIDPEERARRAAGIAAGSESGFSNGQAGTLVELTRQMVEILRLISRGQGFPEAKHQKRSAGATGDFM